MGSTLGEQRIAFAKGKFLATPLAGLIFWTSKHWVGISHTLSQTVLALALWHLFSKHKFTVIPFTIVFIYLVTLLPLNKRNNAIVK